jgi:phage tail tape-measure protein
VTLILAIFFADAIALMAISRRYLGGHFAADVLGGLVVGVVALALARLELSPAGAGISTLTAGTRTALDVSLIVAVALAALSGAGLGALMMPAVSVASWARPSCSSTRGRSRIPPRRRRGWPAWRRGSSFLAWRSGQHVDDHDGGRSRGHESTMAVSAALHASLLLLPALALALGGNRS